VTQIRERRGEGILPRQIERVEVAEVRKSADEEEAAQVPLGQDQEVENAGNQVDQIEEPSEKPLVAEIRVQTEEGIGIETLIRIQVRITTTEEKVAQGGRSVHVRDLHRKSIRKNDAKNIKASNMLPHMYVLRRWYGNSLNT